MKESVIDFPKDCLCPEVWEKVMDEEGASEVWRMIPEVKEKLFIIATTLCPDATVIHVTGSITSNQYTKNADIDLHFKADNMKFNSNDEVDDYNKKLRRRYEKAGRQYVGEHPIEVYYQESEFQDFMSVGCYNIFEDRWEVGPEFTDPSFNPYSEYYKEIKGKSEELANQIRSKILSIYENAVVLKKNIGKEYEKEVRSMLLEQLAMVQALYDNIRRMRKIYSSPTSKEEAFKFRASRKWKIADGAFKLFDKYGYLAILKKFIEDFEILSSSDSMDVEISADIISTVKDYIGNADKLSEEEFDESELNESKGDKSSNSMTPDEYSQHLLNKLGADPKYVPKHTNRSIMDSLAHEYILEMPTDTAAREIEMDAVLLLMKSNDEKAIKIGKKLGDIIISSKGRDKLLDMIRKAYFAFLHMPDDVNEDEQVDESSHNKVKIWVDDVRSTPPGYMTIQSVDEFIEWFDKNGIDKIEVLDLDHDAGKFHDKGGDYIKILDYLEFQGVEDLKVRIHSDNPVGRQNMQRIIKKNGWKEVYDLMTDAEQVDEGAMSNALLAALLAIPGILPAKTIQKSIDNNQRYEMIVKDINNNVRMIGDYTAFQAANIIARTLYAEARNDGEKGMTAVASVIYNRAKGNKEDFTKVCLKPKQFSCWNKFTKEEADPKRFQVKIPVSVKGNAKNDELWKKAMSIVADMLADSFKPTTTANTYYNPKTANPKWAKSLIDAQMIGSHKFGTIKRHSAFV